MNEETTSERIPGRRTRMFARFGAVLLLFAALIFAPPLFNVSRLQHHIAASMSQSLGRPVSMGKVTLHLLPMPGFTLNDLVVSEDPAFGYEPTIRAGKVEVTLRPSSLWRRRVELSSIKFEVDDNGSAPNLNLVRNAQGKWNLEGLLMRAAQVGIAPTAQPKPGPDPRFPYIEATGGRINVKVGNEKLPFALTDADFALWLPDPQQWQVRLEARPMRTDTNVSDTGEVRLEGSLGRAAVITEMPVDLHASWQNAPLGEVSKVVLGGDADWRGTLMAQATLLGKLGDADLKTTVSIEELRRADFVPAKTLDFVADCGSKINVTTGILLSPQCNFPASSDLPQTQVSATSDRIDLAAPQNARLQIGSPGVSESWVLDWARLFSQRLPECETCANTLINGSLVYLGGADTGGGRWQGRIEGSAPSAFGHASPDSSQFDFEIAAAGDKFLLAPINLEEPGKPPLSLSGAFDKNEYSLTLIGTATEAQIRTLEMDMPPVGEALDKLLPDVFSDTTKPSKLNILCSRKWGAEETCVSLPMEFPPSKPRRRDKSAAH